MNIHIAILYLTLDLDLKLNSNQLRKVGSIMKLLIENPTEEVLEKLRNKRAMLESDLEGIVIGEVLNINPGALGIRVIFMTHINISEEIVLINSDFRRLDLFIN